MKYGVRHSLPPEQLRLAVRKFAEVYGERFREYQTSVTWQSDEQLEVTFKVKGIRLVGTLVLTPHEIMISMDVPLPFRLFQRRAMAAIEEEVQPWLDKAARGEL